ncbi:TPA: fimbrial protein [Serratia fonticola]|nr:fimbrial protein [Serratia fonticola]HBE9092607.1 fimbrial protein [Serratia fonticola]HBE9154957.1 fimbrial protein [Serratia fonticola]
MTKGDKVRHSLLTLLLGTTLLLTGPSAIAFTTVTVKATVLNPPSCVINGNQPIEVNFGDEVMTNKVDGKNYMQRVKYSLQCTGGDTNALRLQIQGEPTGFNPAALATAQQSNLGIELWANAVRFPVNSWLDFTYPYTPVIQAVPVKKTGTTLAAGKFSAVATLKIDVQ